MLTTSTGAEKVKPTAKSRNRAGNFRRNSPRANPSAPPASSTTLIANKTAVSDMSLPSGESNLRLPSPLLQLDISQADTPRRPTMPSYNPAEVERRWQQFWEANKTFRTPDPGEPGAAGKPPLYILDMFPYPSGSGLHVGHPEGYTATDI